MFNFDAKTSEILERGKEERGNFEPTGAPLRVYNYWLNNSDGSKAASIKLGRRRENFCHFWRVVAIWAPLLWLALLVKKFTSTKIGAAIALAVSLGIVAWACFASNDVFGLVLIALAAVAVGVGGLGIGLAIRALHARYWNSRWNDVAFKVFAGIFIAFALGLVVFAIVLATLEVWWTPLVVLAGAVFCVLIAFGASKFSDYLSGRRALARQQHQEFIDSLTYEELEAYIAERNARRQPGRISKFFSGLGDFLIFVMQIVRVKKWKICPVVNIKVN